LCSCCEFYSYSAIIKNKLYYRGGLYICFVQNIRILRNNMIHFHECEIKSSASHFTLIIKRHCEFSKSINSPAHHASVIRPELEQFFSKSPCGPQNCHCRPILYVIMETKVSSFSFLLDMVFQHCAQQVNTLYDLKL